MLIVSMGLNFGKPKIRNGRQNIIKIELLLIYHIGKPICNLLFLCGCSLEINFFCFF